MVDEEENATCYLVRNNLADFDKVLIKATRSSFEDADFDNIFASGNSPCGKVESFDDLLEGLCSFIYLADLHAWSHLLMLISR